MLAPAHVNEIRSHFPVFRNRIYMNSCSQGALSDAVRQSFNRYLETWDEHGSPWDIWVDEYESARRTFAGFIGASPEQLAVLPSVSAGINSIASALSFRERSKVVLSVFDFPTMGHIWLAQQPRGARVHFVRAVGDRMPVEGYERAIDKNTLIVPIAGMCFMNGWRAEVEKITALAHANGALVLLDDYQDCGTRPVDVMALGVDIYVAGTLKYLLGPSGAAMMYVRADLVKTLVPTISGWFAQSNPFAFDVTTLDMSPSGRRFESGTPAIPNIYGAREGVRLLESIGMPEVADHIASLAARLLRGAGELGIKAKTPCDSVGPLVVLKCKNAEAVVKKLAARQIIVSSRHDGLRVGMHVYNTPGDVDVLLDVLSQEIGEFVLESEIAAS